MKIYKDIVLVATENIQPYFNNPRTNDKTIVALVKMIKEVGFNVPIFIDKNNIIIKGHSRYYAARELGMKEIPCIISEATDKQNNADRLYDNAIAELSEWNTDKLLIEIRDLDIKLDEIDFKVDVDYLDTNQKEIYQDAISQKDMERAKSNIEQQYEKKDKKLKFQCPNCSEVLYFSEAQIGGLFKDA